jgi:ADP-heptose:LPS heptosyltransferase
MPLTALEALADLPCDWVSVQKGQPAESELTEISGPWAQAGIREVAQDLNDFSDTAALLANLDLLITVDTSTAHLAAAMGCPVWILNRFDNCWRWLEDRSDSPWYDSVRLYRQKSPGDWRSVVAQVRQDLLELLAERSSQARI